MKRQQQGQGSTSLLDNDGGKRSGIVQQTINKETFRSQFRAFMRKKPKFHYSMDPNTDSEFSDFEL